MTTSLADLRLAASGKVREIYEDGDELIMVASDRISVYDVILPTEIPDKGKVLTQMSLFWFELTGDIVPNHFISLDVPPEAAGRAMRVKKLAMYPIECVVRGYLSGSGWREYRESGSICGIELPEGLTESEKLPEPIFTPATKAEIGDHDENVDFERAAEIVGDRALMEELRCLVCQNQTIADSNAPLALDLRNQIRAQVAQGITRGARVSLERNQGLGPLQSLGAIDRSYDGLIRAGCGLESSRCFLRNNCKLRRAAGYDSGGKNEKGRILKAIRFHDSPALLLLKNARRIRLKVWL